MENKGLGVLDTAFSRSGITNMTNRQMASELFQVFFMENLADQTHSPLTPDLAAITDGNSGTFLTTVLESIKTVISNPRNIQPWPVDPKNTTGLTGFIV